MRPNTKLTKRDKSRRPLFLELHEMAAGVKSDECAQLSLQICQHLVRSAFKSRTEVGCSTPRSRLVGSQPPEAFDA
jgi:hypothetical protein